LAEFMSIFGLAGDAVEIGLRVFAQEEHPPAFQINLFWIVAQAASFLLLMVILYLVAFRRITGTLEERRSRIEQGLRDADQARVDREQAAAERLRVLGEARSEAEDILARAQRLADDTRERDMAEVRAQLEQMRERAAADIAAEKDRALADVRNQVADLALAAAARVIGETMNTERERRLVNEFLTEVGTRDGSGRPRGAAN
jgi:F-type H+-transporting ATPase subunit b